MNNNTTTLINESGKKRNFTFDFSFWSHDGYKEESNGLLVPVKDKYADQTQVYEQVGKQVLNNALNGYHCCLFAYGQTGSGKSYSMIGYGPNKGIVPIVSSELFKIVKNETGIKKSFEVNFSMLEIYNERIQDLLIDIDTRPKGGLKVRQSKTLGVYVQNLSKHPVDSFKNIEDKMKEGNKNRSIASTQMNASSSRAHTIITIEFKQIEIMQGKKVSRFSVINLVDLAGSEKIGKTGSTGDRLKEGCSINKSLSVLGQVISVLADKSMGKKKKVVVPYRNSSLTRILQNALGGNSKTLMICALSPSNNNYDESLSTLRYADQAKRIKCHAVINESETDKKIRMLQTENNELKKMIEKMKLEKNPVQLNSMMEPDNNFEKEQKEQLENKIKDLEQTLQANKMVMNEFEKTFEERLQEEKNHHKKQVQNDYTIPHLINLNEDPMLTGQIYHNLSKINSLYIGRSNGDPKPQIIIHAIGIKPNHAVIEREDDKFYLSPLEKDAKNFLFLNGVNVAEKSELKHCDRIVFGITAFFLFKNPLNPQLPEGFISEEEIDWERVQMEMSKKNNAFNLFTDDEEQKRKNERYKQIEQGLEKIKIDHEQELEKLKKEHEDKLIQIQQNFSQMQSMEMDKEDLINMEIQKYEEFQQEFENNFTKQLQVEKTKKQEIEKEVMEDFKEKDKVKLESKMSKIHPNIIEVNLIAQELKRNISFTIHISYFYIDFDNINRYEKQKKYRIKVRVDNHELGYYYYWNLAKFTSRYFMIKELLEKFYENSIYPELSQEEDPFWDPPEHQKVGEGFLKLMSIAYLMDNPNELILVGDEGKSGLLKVDVVPTDQDGQILQADDPIFDEFIDDPNDLKGKQIQFIISIDTARLPENLANQPYVQYTLKMQNEEGKLEDQVFQTPILEGKQTAPDFQYRELHTYQNVTDEILAYLLKNNVYAYPDRATSQIISSIRQSSVYDLQESHLLESQPKVHYPVQEKVQQQEKEKIEEYNQKILSNKKKKKKNKKSKKSKKQKSKVCLIF